MKYEERLLLAIGLTLGILIFWTLLSPPPEPPPLNPPPVESELLLSTVPAAPENAEYFELGSASFGIGSVRGGIVDLKVDGARPISNYTPGLFQLKWSDPSTYQIKIINKWENQTTIKTEYFNKNGIIATRDISRSFDEPRYLYTCRFSITNTSSEILSQKVKISVFCPIHIDHPNEKRYQAGVAWIGGKVHNLPLNSSQVKVFEGSPKWITSQGKSHAIIVKPVRPTGRFHVKKAASGISIGWLELPELVLSPGSSEQFEFLFYTGPIDFSILKPIGLDGMISFGAFSEVSRWLIGILDWSNARLNNYGLSICLLSFLMWLLMSPITFYGTRMSMMTMEKMAKVKPQEARIRAEFSKNPQKMQQELMQLYKRQGINPAVGCIGCLPLLLTMPIYMALFQVLNRAPQLRGANFLWMKDLSSPDAILRFPATLPLMGDSFNILPILATTAMFLQQKSMQKPQSTAMTPEERMQKKIMNFFPIMLLVFFYKLPSGFMLYWVINSGLMAIQQILLQRNLKKS